MNAYYTNQYISTTLATVGGIDNSQTTGIIIASVTNIETAKPGIACISYTDPVDTSKAEWITYTSIDSVTKEFQGVTRGQEGYGAKPHDNGVTIAFPLSKSHINNLNDALIIDGVATNLVTGVISPTGTSSDSDTELVTKSYADLMGEGVNRQAIINGNFVVNQRVYVSNAVLSAGAYGHDRWKAGAGGGDYTFTQLASSTQITIKAGKSLIQVVEDKNVVGGTYTLSWEGTAQARFGINSATPSGSYASSPITITTQTAGTVMSVEFNAGTLGKVQLNSGSVALPFQPKSFEEELRACMRYYIKSYPYATAPGTDLSASFYLAHFTVVANAVDISYAFPVRMRANPTFTIYSATGASGKVRSITGGADITPSGAFAWDMGWGMYGGTVSAAQKLAYHYTAEAEL